MIFRYFDDWIVVKTTEDLSDITEILVRKRQDETAVRVETIDWEKTAGSMT